jgi:hypothetical protein
MFQLKIQTFHLKSQTFHLLIETVRFLTYNFNYGRVTAHIKYRRDYPMSDWADNKDRMKECNSIAVEINAYPQSNRRFPLPYAGIYGVGACGGLSFTFIR